MDRHRQVRAKVAASEPAALLGVPDEVPREEKVSAAPDTDNRYFFLYHFVL